MENQVVNQSESGNLSPAEQAQIGRGPLDVEGMIRRAVESALAARPAAPVVAEVRPASAIPLEWTALRPDNGNRCGTCRQPEMIYYRQGGNGVESRSSCINPFCPDKTPPEADNG